MSDIINRRSFTATGLASAAALLGASANAQQPAGAEAAQARGGKTQITILLYPGVTMLDWVGPYEALHRVPGVEVILASETTDLMKSDSGIVDYKANVSLDQITRTDVVLVPGGAEGVTAVCNDPVVMDWLRRINRTTTYTVGVCTGSIILARAGLLKGKRATTYWAFPKLIEAEGATFVPERWVQDGKYWTSAGVSAGIDISLALIADIYGPKRAMMTQLSIEYDPHPPFNSGSVRTAPKDVLDAMARP